MTIKAIKEQYKDYQRSVGEKNIFATYDFGGDFGKCVVVVNYCRGYAESVMQVVRVSDGKALLEEGRSRYCDNLDDAIDVAMEMLAEKR